MEKTEEENWKFVYKIIIQFIYLKELNKFGI